MKNSFITTGNNKIRVEITKHHILDLSSLVYDISSTLLY